MQFITDEQRTTKLNEEQTEYLFQLIEKSRKHETKFKRRVTTWKKAVQGLQLKLRRGKQAERVDLTINLAYAHLRAKLPTLFFQEPTVVTTPRRKKDAESAPVWQKFLNNLIRRNGYKRETKRTTNNAIISGEGWKKIVVSQAGQSGQTTARGGATGDVGAGPQTEAGSGPSEWAKQMMVSSVWVPTEDVIVDYQAKGRDLYGGSCRYVIIRYLKSLSELHLDPRYKIPKNLDATKFVTTRDGITAHSDGNRSMNNRDTMVEEDQVFIYEVWVHQLAATTQTGSNKPDLKMYKQMAVLMDGAKVPIRQPIPWADFYGREFPGWPVHKFELNSIPSDYPISEFEAWYQLQQAINFVMSRAVDQIANQGPVDIITKSAVENPEKVMRDLDKGAPRTTIAVKSGRAGDAFFRQSATPIQHDLFTILSPLISLTERVSGSSRNRQQQAGIRTATEARNIQNMSEIVEGEHIDIVREFLKEDIQKITAVLKEFADSDYVKNVVGETGPIPWDEGFSDFEKAMMPEIDIEVDSFRSPFENRLNQKWTTILQFSMSLLQVVPNLRIDVIYEKWLDSLKVDSGRIMHNTDDDRLKQMMEIMTMLNDGQYIEAKPDENHQAELEVIRNFKNSDAYKNSDPSFQQLLARHEDQHMEFADLLGDSVNQFTAQMKSMGLNPAVSAQNNPDLNGIATPQEGLGI